MTGPDRAPADAETTMSDRPVNGWNHDIFFPAVNGTLNLTGPGTDERNG